MQEFEFHLEDNIFKLHEDLEESTYSPGNYQQFEVTDPKRRIINKASVRDRVLHQAVYQILYQTFDKTFIYDSYSCRNNKGTHKAFQRLIMLTRQISKNFTESCWGLKMDVRKFFDSIDHAILLNLLDERTDDPRLMKLLSDIVRSFSFCQGKGMPLGNLTSQLFANVYMDPLDKFVKHSLRAKHYVRYADDFILLSQNPDELMRYLIEINIFLKEKLKLQIHPHKISLRKLHQGIDFVGYIALPNYQIPRSKTVKRIFKKADEMDSYNLEKAMPSYLGYLGHANSFYTRSKLNSTFNTFQNFENEIL